MSGAVFLALNPYEIISGVLRDVIDWGLTQLGIGGVATGAVLVALVWLWWGYKLSAVASAGRSVGATIAQHAVVSAAVAAAVLFGLLYAGVIPGVDLQAAGALVSGALDVLPLFISVDVAAPVVAFFKGLGMLADAIVGGTWKMLSAGAQETLEAITW